MSSHALLQGIFPTRGWNPCLLHLLPWLVDSLLLSPLGGPSGTDPPVIRATILNMAVEVPMEIETEASS